MAKQVKLTAERRDRHGPFGGAKIKAQGVGARSHLRRRRQQPEAAPGFAARHFIAVLSHASGENILGRARNRGESSAGWRSSRKLQHSPVGGDILHVDFHAVSMDEVIEADVPLEPTGTAEGVKNFRRSARAKPAFARDRMSAARSAGYHYASTFLHLDIGDAIHVREIPLPEG